MSPRDRAAWRLCLAAVLLSGAAATDAAAQTVTLSVPAGTSLAEDGGSRDVAVTATLSSARTSATVVTLSLGGTARSTDYAVQYADDCNIYVRSHRAGDRVMSSVCRFVTTQLRLKVNVSKSAVARPEERKFLGFRITNDGRQRQIAPQALARFKMRLRELTRRTLGLSLPQLVEQLAPYLVGWRGYFGFCDAPRVLANLDAWIRRRLRMYLWRQWQSGRHRFQELRRRGVSQFHAAVAAGSPTGFWRMSRHPAVQQALRNRYFDSVGLPRLAASSNA